MLLKPFHFADFHRILWNMYQYRHQKITLQRFSIHLAPVYSVGGPIMRSLLITRRCGNMVNGINFLLFFIAGMMHPCISFILPSTTSIRKATATSINRLVSVPSTRSLISKGSSARVTRKDMSTTSGSDEEVLVPQGTHYGWYSLIGPLSEALSWSSTPGTYFNDLIEKNNGAPVFKCHPGLASITFTDHTTAEWFFNQPETVLDRQVSRSAGELGAVFWSEIVRTGQNISIYLMHGWTLSSGFSRRLNFANLITKDTKFAFLTPYRT